MLYVYPPHKSIKRNDIKFQYIDFIYDDENRKKVNNELEKLIFNIDEKVKYIASRNYVIIPILDAITNDLNHMKDKEKILSELYGFHKDLSFIGYKLTNWNSFWIKIWEIRCIIDNYYGLMHHNQPELFYELQNTGEENLLEKDIFNNISYLILDERFKKIIDFTIKGFSDEGESIKKLVINKIKRNSISIDKNFIDREIIYHILSANNLLFSEFVQLSVGYLIENIKNIEKLFHSLLSLLSSTYYYIINNNDGERFTKIRKNYNEKLNINKILDIDIIEENKRIYTESSKYKLFQNAVNFKKFIVRELEIRNNENFDFSSYYMTRESIKTLNSWANKYGVSLLSRRLNISKEDAVGILNKIESSVPLDKIQAQYNFKNNLSSIIIRPIIAHCKKNLKYQRKDAIDFIKNTVYIIQKKYLTEDEMASILQIDIDIIRNWVKNIDKISI